MGCKAWDSSDFPSAEKQFRAAYWYAQVSHAGPQAEAAALYNYALAAGQLGQFPKAEDGLKRTMALDEKTEGKEGPLAAKRLLELARLYQAWEKYDLSREYYQKAFPLLDRYGAEAKDPPGAALVLKDYANVLEKTGLSAEAEAARSRAAALEKEHPGEQPKTRFRHYPAIPFGSTRTESDRLGRIIEDLRAGRVSCVVVTSIPARTETFVAVTCDALAPSSGWEVRTNCETTVREDLLQALEGTRTAPTKAQGDMRWHADLVGANGEPVHTICMAPYSIGSDIAAFDGVPAKVNSALRKWFQKSFPDEPKSRQR